MKRNTMSAPINSISGLPSMEKLQNFVQTFQEKNQKASFADVEKQLHKMVMNIEKEALETCLSEYDIDVPAICVDGEIYKKVVRCDQDYQSAAGLLRITRSLYRVNNDEKTICPLELKAGIIEGYWTPAAARQSIWAVAHMTPKESEELFKEIGNMEPSKSSLDRLPKKLGDLWESTFVENQAIVRLDEKIPEEAVTVAVCLDGVMIPMSKVDDNNDSEMSAQYKEASCGTISLYDKDGERLSTIQIGRMPEHKKATLKLQLKEELDRLLEKRPSLNIVKLADGAKDNWDFLENEIVKGVSILDFWHMSEYVKEAFDAAYPNDASKSKGQFEKYKTILKEDKKGVDKLIRCLLNLRDAHPKSTAISDTLKYIRNNKHRMGYAAALESNLPIGSGVVEASCKTLVTQRMKRSGMRWQMHGGQSILSFRSLIKSNRYDKSWELISLKYRGIVEMPKNILKFPIKKHV
jgi:hypothetical protein